MLEKKKTELIGEYLQLKFPLCEIQITQTGVGEAQNYRIDRGGRIDHLLISRAFLESCAKEVLLPTLEQLDLYTLFSRAKGRKVLILSEGIRFE